MDLRQPSLDFGWNTDVHSIPDPAVVLCMDGTYALLYFSGPGRRGNLVRGFRTSADARAFEAGRRVG